MKEKHKLIIWIALDVLLLVGLILCFSYWVEISATLKSPCVVCAKGTPKEECFRNTPLPQFQINFTELENGNKIIINNQS